MTSLSPKGRLFKFMPYNQFLFNLLLNGEFWMCPPDKLNDPFDCGFLISNINKFQNKEFIEKLLRVSNKNFVDDFAYDDRLLKATQDEYYFFNILSEYLNGLIMSRFGITCFSRNAKSLKMWSHYADSHKGICLIFDEEKLRNYYLHARSGVSLKDVKYDSNLPFIDLIDRYDSDTSKECIDIPRNNNRFLFRKLNSWKEEKEVRLVLEYRFDIFSTRDLRFDKTCLVGVIFGSRTEFENAKTLINLIRDSYNSHKVDFYKAKKRLDKPSIRIEKVKLY